MKLDQIWVRRAAVVAIAGAMAVAPLAGCQSNTTSTTSGSDSSASQASDSTNGTIEVTIDDTSCKLTANTAKSGVVTFKVTNNGTAVNEFEILAEDKLQIVTERENLTPGTTTEVTALLEPGTYYTASKTNMVGALVDATEFVVEDSGEAVAVSSDEQELRDNALTMYTAYIRDQAGQLVEATNNFVEAYRSGDTAKAKELYPLARMYYERVEPTAEAFGDIDPNLDLREADAKAGDVEDMADWKGWHAIEKDLWTPEEANYTAEQKTALADALVADTKAFYDLVYSNDFSIKIDDVTNGAISLLEEVATSKITGEEEAFSHTDLYDFQANVEGAKVAYGNVKSIVEKKDPDLAKEIDEAFDTLETYLSKYNTGTSEAPVYPSYTEIDSNAGAEQDEDNLSTGARELSDAVNALRSALGDLTAVVLS
ncbi:iron uptake system protein EfeO [Paratractidigestivibacter sp.]|uniref:iron uptake system protein EfeO n=1 Tax=Paratractidigestivibacter sp. TaxID=2847316 RepID=UPI002ABD762E|nr:iron uptake system protein EfeO [Paratractidigestivibacter sp.]